MINYNDHYHDNCAYHDDADEDGIDEGMIS